MADIRDAVERGAALTRQLLIFGRKEVRAPGLIDVNEVVAGVERLLMRVLGSAVHIELRRDVDVALVVADASQIEQVLVNLAVNSRDAMLRGGTLTIRTSGTTLDFAAAAMLNVAPGSYVTIDVEDTGVGMDEATRNHAFEPFFTTKGPAQGAGLGLAMVYGIVRQSGGAIDLHSAPGAGNAGAHSSAARRSRRRVASGVRAVVQSRPRAPRRGRAARARAGATAAAARRLRSARGVATARRDRASSTSAAPTSPSSSPMW